MSSVPADDAASTTRSSLVSLTRPAASVPARAAGLEWSHSRQHLYDTCHRAFYYSTELAREGWRRDATEDARAARRLKSLTSLPLVVGIALHERAAETARAIRANEPLPTLVAMRERTRHALNHVWHSSQTRRAEWMLQPTHVPMLREHYYGKVPSADQLARVKEQIEHGLTSLRGLALWGEVGALDPHNIALVDKLESYLLEPPEGDGSGVVRVWAAPDLVVRYGDGGQVIVIDYKSGPVACGAALRRHIAQVASYAVQLRSTGVLAAGEGCRGLLVYLRDGTEVPFEVTAKDIDDAAKRIRAGARDMALARTIADHAAMDAVIEARESGLSAAAAAVHEERARRGSSGYAMTSDRAKCRDCPFREVCARHEGIDFEEPPAARAAA